MGNAMHQYALFGTAQFKSIRRSHIYRTNTDKSSFATTVQTYATQR